MYSIILELQSKIYALQLHYSNYSVMLWVNYRCIIVHYRKQLWAVFNHVVLLVVQEVTVGHIACGRLHVTEYVFLDVIMFFCTTLCHALLE